MHAILSRPNLGSNHPLPPPPLPPSALGGIDTGTRGDPLEQYNSARSTGSSKSALSAPWTPNPVSGPVWRRGTFQKRRRGGIALYSSSEQPFVSHQTAFFCLVLNREWGNGSPY